MTWPGSQREKGIACELVHLGGVGGWYRTGPILSHFSSNVSHSLTLPPIPNVSNIHVQSSGILDPKWKEAYRAFQGIDAFKKCLMTPYLKKEVRDTGRGGGVLSW